MKDKQGIELVDWGNKVVVWLNEPNQGKIRKIIKLGQASETIKAFIQEAIKTIAPAKADEVELQAEPEIMNISPWKQVVKRKPNTHLA